MFAATTSTRSSTLTMQPYIFYFNLKVTIHVFIRFDLHANTVVMKMVLTWATPLEAGLDKNIQHLQHMPHQSLSYICS
jgi:hypothetical protein